MAEATEATFTEFEATDRLEWAKSKINLLKQLTKVEKNEEPSTVESQAEPLESAPLPQSSVKSPKIDAKEILTEKPKSDFLNIPSSLPKAVKSSGNQSTLQFSDSMQAQHDSLTEELIQTVQLIRRNNIHLRDMVKADDQVIEEATTLLTGNTDKINREGRKLKEYSRTVWMTTWRMLSLMFTAVFVFLLAYLFIRLT